MHVFLAPEQTANLFPTVTLVHTLRTVGLYGDFKREIEAKLTGKTAVTYFIMNGNAGVRAGVWASVGASLCPYLHKEVLPKRNPKIQKDERTKNEHEKKSRYFLGGNQCRWHLLGGIQCRRYFLGGIQCWRYLLGGIQCWGTFWAVSRVGGTLLVVWRVGGTF